MAPTDDTPDLNIGDIRILEILRDADRAIAITAIHSASRNIDRASGGGMDIMDMFESRLGIHGFTRMQGHLNRLADRHLITSRESHVTHTMLHQITDDGRLALERRAAEATAATAAAPKLQLSGTQIRVLAELARTEGDTRTALDIAGRIGMTVDTTTDALIDLAQVRMASGITGGPRDMSDWSITDAGAAYMAEEQPVGGITSIGVGYIPATPAPAAAVPDYVHRPELGIEPREHGIRFNHPNGDRVTVGMPSRSDARTLVKHMQFLDHTVQSLNKFEAEHVSRNGEIFVRYTEWSTYK